jgi:hypothetical protein
MVLVATVICCAVTVTAAAWVCSCIVAGLCDRRGALTIDAWDDLVRSLEPTSAGFGSFDRAWGAIAIGGAFWVHCDGDGGSRVRRTREGSRERYEKAKG